MDIQTVIFVKEETKLLIGNQISYIGDEFRVAMRYPYNRLLLNIESDYHSIKPNISLKIELL